MKVIIMEVLIVVVYAKSVKALTVAITLALFALFLKKHIEACLLCLMTYSKARVAIESQFGLEGNDVCEPETILDGYVKLLNLNLRFC